VAGGGDGFLYLFDGAGRLLDRQRVGAAVSALSLSTSTLTLLAGSTNGTVSVYVVSERLDLLSSFTARGSVTSVAISEDGSRLSVATVNGTITTFDRSLGEPLWTYNAGGIVHAICMSADGRFMAAASDTGSVYFFNEHMRALDLESALLCVAPVTFVAALAVIVLIRRRRIRRSA
jgi:WD40 repeat protein